MSAHPFEDFLAEQDAVCAVAGDIDLRQVVGILPAATSSQLLAVANSRLSRQIAMLYELSCMPTNADISAVPIFDATVASLQEVKNLLDAAQGRLRDESEGGS